MLGLMQSEECIQVSEMLLAYSLYMGKYRPCKAHKDLLRSAVGKSKYVSSIQLTEEDAKLSLAELEQKYPPPDYATDT